MGHFFLRNKPSNNMKTALLGLCLLVLVSVPQLDATVAITVGTLALTAPQVTGLIALKALAIGAVAKGFLIGRALRGRRSADWEVETDIVSQIANNELEKCTASYECSIKLENLVEVINSL